MPTLQIRDVPKELHEKLLMVAKKERRSLSQQALYLLEKSLQLEDNKLRRQTVVSILRDSKIKYGKLSDPTKMIRADRDK